MADRDHAGALAVGKDYQTRGGWKARILWREARSAYGGTSYFLAVHRPGDREESGPVRHKDDGTAIDPSPVLFGRPPSYGLHPADLMGPWPGAAEPAVPAVMASADRNHDIIEDDGEIDVPVMEGAVS